MSVEETAGAKEKINIISDGKYIEIQDVNALAQRGAALFFNSDVYEKKYLAKNNILAKSSAGGMSIMRTDESGEVLKRYFFSSGSGGVLIRPEIWENYVISVAERPNKSKKFGVSVYLKYFNTINGRSSHVDLTDEFAKEIPYKNRMVEVASVFVERNYLYAAVYLKDLSSVSARENTAYIFIYDLAASKSYPAVKIPLDISADPYFSEDADGVRTANFAFWDIQDIYAGDKYIAVKMSASRGEERLASGVHEESMQTLAGFLIINNDGGEAPLAFMPFAASLSAETFAVYGDKLYFTKNGDLLSVNLKKKAKTLSLPLLPKAAASLPNTFKFTTEIKNKNILDFTVADDAKRPYIVYLSLSDSGEGKYDIKNIKK
ncbi:hypothetical protein Dip518_001519 [Parelusimicrobium proximum]|uniref:hypothetical protein n=1 Tax=Parelusimicrobium proximum TaxID=3228953 RepID=UPI003D172D27